MQPAPQFIRFTKAFQEGYIYIIPEHMIFAETGERVEKGQKVATPYTVIHVTGKEGKVFVKEHPDEINKILRELKHIITWKG